MLVRMWVTLVCFVPPPTKQTMNQNMCRYWHTQYASFADQAGTCQAQPTHPRGVQCCPGGAREHPQQHTSKLLQRHHKFSQGKQGTFTKIKKTLILTWVHCPSCTVFLLHTLSSHFMWPKYISLFSPTQRYATMSCPLLPAWTPSCLLEPCTLWSVVNTYRRLVLNKSRYLILLLYLNDNNKTYNVK